jgi:hypothetical protein
VKRPFWRILFPIVLLAALAAGPAAAGQDPYDCEDEFGSQHSNRGYWLDGCFKNPCGLGWDWCPCTTSVLATYNHAGMLENMETCCQVWPPTQYGFHSCMLSAGQWLCVQCQP